ncbi:hypothetical protein BJY16_002715 [Actinoplanes octamycinicus]|uniref:DOD-type homing endonuclease domain-containing protein n=1 Tax=Actinoplanes octamycinicus TaxID=135948 RepID=A0A7W7GVU7_9ACTN|nr:LAGLIDADG family homing endonuclease [Actinoplanes octamycinicus]MBB4739256.1 hypothetical protein [Actinoplanes octamycinicus]GIE58768.1 hypothetical protein Aoc01nite_41700 [Actinoplanes octamycinicus]
MEGVAEGAKVWLAGGTTAPIEEVARSDLAVLSYDRPWDIRPVRYGPHQPVRDRRVGTVVPTVLSACRDLGPRSVVAVRFASGRTMETTAGHRWVRQRRSGLQVWEWVSTPELKPGDRVPIPLTVGFPGTDGDADDGYFVGAMLGDGGMTSVTPEFHGDPHDGAVAFLREYADRHGCGVREYPNGKIVRVRFPYQRWKRNPLTEVLRRYGVWGLRCESKALPDVPFSQAFWVGVLAGLVDTDGSVRRRVNAKGTVHGSIEYASVSSRLAWQASDALLRLGVTSIVREKAARHQPQSSIRSRLPIFVVEVNRATALARLASRLDLRIEYKAARLAQLAADLGHVRPASSQLHGYDEAVALDRVVSVSQVGDRRSYGMVAEPSRLIVVNGIVTGC